VTKDEKYMRRCLELAANGEGWTAPNPLVGCVIVHGGRIVGEGWHRRYGEAHAEVNAIASVADPAVLRESTLYVSLEPCSHWGKTPPCADLIVEKGIPRVVIGMIDPYAEVAGRGIRKLKEAGIEVTVGVLEAECRALNRRFITFQTERRPCVTLKWAQTVDGYLDNNRPCGVPPAWMTGRLSRTLVHRMRACSAAILTGTNTIERDNPSLTVRESGGKSPLRVVPDRTLRLSPAARVFDGETPTLVVTDRGNAVEARKRYPRCEAAEIDFSKPAVPQILDLLYERKIESLFVEGGEQLLRSFIEAGKWDEAYIFVSPLSVSDLPGGTPVEPLGTPAPPIPGIAVSRDVIDGVTLIYCAANR
jgi:diaminohydroxyphosphoribosylaminopyrimidine deaminase/5-amino-6-(5-phosphoribosylamino)uracil reductase